MDVVYVRMLSGDELKYEGPIGSTIWDLKGWIKCSAGIPKRCQHIFINGTRALANEVVDGHMFPTLFARRVDVTGN